jgi:arylamine N-acetyltransferase
VGQRQIKRLRRLVNKQKRKIVFANLDALREKPIRRRLKFLWAMLFKRKDDTANG